MLRCLKNFTKALITLCLSESKAEKIKRNLQAKFAERLLINVKANLKHKYWFGRSNDVAKQKYNKCCREEAKIVARTKLSDARFGKRAKKK